MEGDLINLNKKIYSNNNTILLSIIKDLQQTMNDSRENNTIKRLGDIIIKMNSVISENKKNTELIRNDISKLYSQMNKQFQDLKNNINALNYKEIKYDFENKNDEIKRVKYIGQVLNGVPEGKGTMYWNEGSRYEGDWKNNKKEGKGILYWSSGNRYEGEFKNGAYDGKGIMYYTDGDRYEGEWKKDNKEGKGIYYFNNGDRYEGDFKNGERNGKGIMYYSNGDREMGDYSNDGKIGKHVMLTKNGNIKENYY